jgi:hypothetical protein
VSCLNKYGNNYVGLKYYIYTYKLLSVHDIVRGIYSKYLDRMRSCNQPIDVDESEMMGGQAFRCVNMLLTDAFFGGLHSSVPSVSSVNDRCLLASHFKRVAARRSAAASELRIKRSNFCSYFHLQ